MQSRLKSSDAELVLAILLGFENVLKPKVGSKKRVELGPCVLGHYSWNLHCRHGRTLEPCCENKGENLDYEAAPGWKLGA